MPAWLELLGMFLTGSLLTAIFNAWVNRRKHDADIAKLFAETAAQLVGQSNEQLAVVRQQYVEMKTENAGLIAEIGRLDGLIERLEREIKEKNIEADSMRDEIRNLRKELAVKDREIEALEGENAELKQRVSDLERKLEKLVGGRDQEN